MVFFVVSFHIVILIFPENTWKKVHPVHHQRFSRHREVGASLACSRKSLADFSVSSSLAPGEDHSLLVAACRRESTNSLCPKAGGSDEWALNSTFVMKTSWWWQTGNADQPSINLIKVWIGSLFSQLVILWTGTQHQRLELSQVDLQMNDY